MSTDILPPIARVLSPPSSPLASNSTASLLSEALRVANKAVSLDQKEEEPIKVINAYARTVRLLDAVNSRSKLDDAAVEKLRSLRDAYTERIRLIARVCGLDVAHTAKRPGSLTAPGLRFTDQDMLSQIP